MAYYKVLPMYPVYLLPMYPVQTMSEFRKKRERRLDLIFTTSLWDVADLKMTPVKYGLRPDCTGQGVLNVGCSACDPYSGTRPCGEAAFSSS